MCCRLPGGICTVIHRLAKQMSIVARKRPLPLSTASFFSCSVLVSSLLPNSHHRGTFPLHTSSYCAIGKSSFSKVDNPSPFKLQYLAPLQNDARKSFDLTKSKRRKSSGKTVLWPWKEEKVSGAGIVSVCFLQHPERLSGDYFSSKTHNLMFARFSKDDIAKSDE
ncbi:hypothetical protein TNCV_2790751 [Trichonephila clavipes]|nr:hypothetical protein TNCV_2790751 [Trichonephila clavipes]